MKRNKNAYTLILSGLLILLAAGCEDPLPPDQTDTFDKKKMLENVAFNTIVPAYDAMYQATDSLNTMTQDFVNAPDIQKLNMLQDQFKRAYLLFEHVSVFEIGPAENELFRANLNTFPCDTAQILTKISAADYNLSAAADIDAKGFPAMDFLLFAKNGDQQFVLNRYTNHTDSTKFRMYLKTLALEISGKATNIYNSWKPGTMSYATTFANNTGSSIGGSIGMLVNQLCFDLELLKNGSIGIPSGKKSMGILYPEKSEGINSGLSLSLAKARLRALENLYLGKGVKPQDSIGFDDYLMHVDAKYGQSSLNEVIKSKFTLAQSMLDLIPETLANSINTQIQLVDDAYNELQQLVVLLKVDMTSALGIQITYQDNDGD